MSAVATECRPAVLVFRVAGVTVSVEVSGPFADELRLAEVREAAVETVLLARPVIKGLSGQPWSEGGAL